MKKLRFGRDEHGKLTLDVGLRGRAVLMRPLLNKGTGFTPDERRTFELEGLLPSQFNTMAMQARRRYAAIASYSEPIEKYVELAGLQDRNETLFYRVLCDHLEEFMPIVYTPTVGKATQQFSEVFRRGRGVWLTPEFQGRMAQVLRKAAPNTGIELLVVTDNESILGIGDQGAGGMAISVGKLALYVAGGGIHPTKTLPISLDVGTDNEALLTNELYVGWRHPRLRGAAYEAIIEEFVEAVRKVFPGALVQWEDFRGDNALAILDKYRDRVLSFNDDIQGTGAVALAGVLSALRITGEPLRAQRVVLHGGGAAGLGIARQLRAAMAEDGLQGEALTRAVAVLDSGGLLADDRELGNAYKYELAWTGAMARDAGLDDPAHRGLAAVVSACRPTVLIGASGQPGAFTRAVIEDMAAQVERPLVMPFSNPTDKAEATPADVIDWSGGRALVATGSPFADVLYQGRTIRVGQGNNVFIFPGLGMGALLAGASQVTDGMISAASRALAEAVREDDLASGLLYPAIRRLRETSRQVTAAVMAKAAEEGVAEALNPEEIEARIKDAVWEPEYPRFVPV